MLTLKLEVDVPNPLPHGEPLGIDLGLEKFLATSTGKLIVRPKFFVSLQGKLKSLQRKMSRKRRGVYFERVDPNLTSQTCPRCQTLTGKKLLSERIHSCPECGYTTDRDVAAAQVVAQRGVASVAVGRTVQASGGIGL